MVIISIEFIINNPGNRSNYIIGLLHKSVTYDDEIEVDYKDIKSNKCTVFIIFKD